MIRLCALIAPALLLTACDSGSNAPATTTKLDSVEVEPGTISDDMIILDTASADGTAVDNSVPADPAAPKATAKAADDSAAKAEGDDVQANAAEDTAKPSAEPADSEGE